MKKPGPENLKPKTCINCFQKERLKLYYQRLIEMLKAFSNASI